jgi:phosphoribosylanthranilate isomerase
LRVRVKICGVTSVGDAIAAADAGSDAVGINCYPGSSRFVDVATAAAISAALPPFITRVAVFVDPAAAEVEKVLDQVNIDLLQFHGDESAEFCEHFQRSYVKAVQMRADVDFHACARRYASAAGLLLDTDDPVRRGGTGKPFDWSLWPSSRPSEWPAPLILAGGLNAGNVAAAIAATQPFAVDVSSGVETPVKGVKDPAKIIAFIKEVSRGSK